MSGATLKDLSEYHQRAMQYFKNGLVSEQNRLFAQTEEAGAVSFWPLGGTPLEGKVKFSFKETPPASGDKGPENPSAIAGVDNIVLGKCGKNIIPKNTVTYNGYGLTISYNSDGCLVLNGTYTGGSTTRYYANTDGSSLFGSIVPCSMRMAANKQYKFWVKLVSGSFSGSIGFYIGNKAHQISIGSTEWDIDEVRSATIPAGYSEKFTIRTDLINNTVYNDCTFQLQLEEGTEITDFEPPMSASEIKTSIPLGDTYYGGEIDLATGVMTVTHTGYVLPVEGKATGWNSDVHVFSVQNLAQSVGRAISGEVCSHFAFSGAWSDSTIHFYMGATTCYIFNSNWSSKQDAIDFLATQKAAGTPVTVTYKLGTPFTVQLTPLQLTALTQKDKYTPRMNTVYTDADSIQIRYRKSLIHDEDEKVQAITALGGNV